MSEIWRDIPGYEGVYAASSEGRIRRVAPYHGAPGIIRPFSSRGGYLIVDLSRDNRRRKHLVHRLVAAAFIGPCPADREVNHKDHDRSNNRVENLEYVTGSENNIHANRAGERNPIAKLTEADVREIRRLWGTEPQWDIARRFGVTQGTVWRAARGLSWSHIQ